MSITNNKKNIKMNKDLRLVAYGELNIAGGLVNIMTNKDVCFGEMNEGNVEIWKKTNRGEWVKIDKRYFNNISEFYPC